MMFFKNMKLMFVFPNDGIGTGTDFPKDGTRTGPNTSVCINSIILLAYVAWDENLTRICFSYM